VVTVRAEDNNAKAITGFYFANPAAVGNIDESGKTITVTVPNGTALNGLVPTVYYTGASLTPASGTAVNFTSPVIYTVTARNGTAQPYTVRVVPKPASTKDITAISFPGAGVLETIIGANPDPGGYTPISVTVSAQTDIGALRPTITHTGASITPPGGTAQSAKPFTDNIRNFGSPQVYTVTAEDGSAKNYAVSVHISGGGAKIITAFVFKAVPVNGGPVVQVAGQINQDTATIEVRVPHAATDLTSLVPTITYLGKSAACSDQGTSMTNAAPTGQTGNTYTDNPRNFSGSGTTPLTYTVTAMDGSTQEYKVKVVKNPEVTVKYVGLKDDKFITEKFEQSTGLLTVTIAHIDYTKPYEWYVDGVKYPVSGAQSTLVLKTTDFQPGQHEVVAAAKKIDGKYYTNKISFLVKE
jgi:hypothetical protein